MRLYVAGPMTGVPDFNFPAFFEAERLLVAAGFTVLNPARHGSGGKGWREYMRLGLRDVLDSDGIATLPGWMDSPGATLEVYVAEQMSWPVRPVEGWLRDEGRQV